MPLSLEGPHPEPRHEAGTTFTLCITLRSIAIVRIRLAAATLHLRGGVHGSREGWVGVLAITPRSMHTTPRTPARLVEATRRQSSLLAPKMRPPCGRQRSKSSSASPNVATGPLVTVRRSQSATTSGERKG